jgi:mannose-6-phosphate isomerase-like protein (cupin superfamily)/catechol 2,3-dioxygenase-like lactoylglutathione lyase family enzyme
MSKVQVRYIVDNVDAAIAFYTNYLGFTLDMHPAPAFAMLSRGDLRLVLSSPNGSGGGGQAMPDGTLPAPGGWNRFTVEVEDIGAIVETLRVAGAQFRNEIVTGVGGKQILLEDPSGNPVELFQPLLPEARLNQSGDVVIEKFNVAEKLASFSDHWSPKVVADLNGQQVKLTKLQGTFEWHHHDTEDELFLVITGRLRMDLRDREIWLEPGEAIVIPRGTEHRPHADVETAIMLFEPASTLNTGNVRSERTVERLDRI